MCIARCDKYPTEKSSTRMPVTISAHIGQPACASRPAGRSVIAAAAAIDASSQFERKESAVKPRFAARRPCFQGLARNIGTAVSSRAPRAMTVRMIEMLIKNSRAVIECLQSIGSVERAGSTATDEYLIFLSGWRRRLRCHTQSRRAEHDVLCCDVAYGCSDQKL
jgi:hypothetical protein